MIWYLVFVLVRLLVTVFFFLTATYSILNYSPFVFNQFIRPRIFGWVNEFVAWHHLWYLGAYLLCVITLIPDLKRQASGDRIATLRRRLALAFIVVFGLVAEWLMVTPYLPKLWNDSRSLYATFFSLVPVLCLALIDHVATRPASLLAGGDIRRGATVVTDQRRLLAACVLAAEYLWIVHLLSAMLRSSADAGALGWTVTSLWALGLNLTAAMLLYAAVGLLVSVASAARTPRAWEYAGMVMLAVGVIAALFLEIVFPTIAFGERAPLAVSLVAGAALALTWSGLALRRPVSSRHASQSGLDLFVSPVIATDRLWPSAVALAALPLAAFLALRNVERLDWNFLVQKVTVVLEWVLAFGFIFGLTRRVASGSWSLVRAIVPPLLPLGMLLLLAGLSHRLGVWTGDLRLEPEVGLDRYSAHDVSFKMLYDGLVRHPGKDNEFFRYLQVNTSVPLRLRLTPPDVRFSKHLEPARATVPRLFLFVVDSVRRDYLAPFNPEVTFTPNIAKFAEESFTFTNAFSHYGGTALGVPAIWAGGLVLHRTSMPGFERSDALEKLLDADLYRWYMSLDTHMGPLIHAHPDLVELDEKQFIMKYDFCKTLGELSQKLDARTDGRPIFAFTLPQNLHISNSQKRPVPPGEHYPGFFAPYATEVHRIDGCFGGFISYLKQKGLYDDSIVVLTTDHGDSHGEAGNWGHGVTIYPEVVRIPLMIHVPERLKTRVTTDLARLTFSTDVTPSLYELLGHSTEDLGPLFGSPLFVAPDRELADRRRGSYLLVSSYAPTYGLLRRHGRSLYIMDLVNGREYAYELRTQPIGARVPVTDDMRRVNQKHMREQIAELASLYNFVPQP